MDGIVLCHRRKDQEVSRDELHPDNEANDSKQTKGELVFDLCNQAVTKIFGFTPQFLERRNTKGILRNSGFELSKTPMFMELKGSFDTGFEMSDFNKVKLLRKKSMKKVNFLDDDQSTNSKAE